MRRYLIIGSLLIAAGVAVSSALAQQGNCEFVGHWEGQLTHREQPYPVLLDVSCNGSTHTATIDFPQYLIYGCDAGFALESDSVILHPAFLRGCVLRLESEGDIFQGTFSGFGDIVARAKLHRENRRPLAYVEKDVAFANGDAKLSGTLVLPPGEGPFATIVWTHGSGPDTRNTFYYAGRAYLLAQHGVASLIYDKRGAGESTGPDSWKLDNLIADALAAVEAIAGRPEADSAHIGIAGFSQGGWIAPAVAAQSSDVDFVVVGATPGITGGEQNIFAMENRLRHSGYDSLAVRAASNLLNQLYRFYQTGEGREELVAALAAAEGQEWFMDETFRSQMFLPESGLPDGRHPYWQPFSPDPVEWWRAIHVPVLSIWGEDDANVPAELSRNRIQSALNAAGNTDFTLKLFPQAGHGLWSETGESEWDWPRQAPGYHELLVRWITEHVAD